jgi:predicted transcriptional regulator
MAVSTTTVKADLKDIASHLSDTATYTDAMYELYVRMKIAQGKRAADEGRVVPHAEVKRRFAV